MKMSIYGPLLEEEIAGIHLLRNMLLEYSDISRVQVIMSRFGDLYARYFQMLQSEDTFTPIFKFFKTSEEDLKIIMYRRLFKAADIEIGTVYLNLIENDDNVELLELDINFVTEEQGNNKTGLTVPEAMAYLKHHFQHFAYHNSRNIVSEMLAYQTLDNLQGGIYTFDISINVNEVTIAVNKFEKPIKAMKFTMP